MSIEDICKTYDITNYTINTDGSIDVHESVYINGWDLDEIPLNFNKVEGLFYCDSNQLTSLEGCPKEVRGDFWCINNPKLPKEEILKLKESGIVKGTIFSDYGNF